MKWLKLIETYGDEEEISYFWTTPEQISSLNYELKWYGSSLEWSWENPPKEWLKQELDQVNFEMWKLERYEDLLTREYMNVLEKDGELEKTTFF